MKLLEDCLLLPKLKKEHELAVFRRLIKQGEEFLGRRNVDALKRYLNPLWLQYAKELQSVVENGLPVNFLRNPTIRRTMMVDARGEWLRHQADFVGRRLRDVAAIARESYVGKPPIAHYSWMTSHNSIHHLYHIMKYEEVCRKSIYQAGVVCEWGGGYGGLAKLIARLRNATQSYIIIDIPVFCFIQYVYLGATLGPERVHLLSNRGDELSGNKIFLVPIEDLAKVKMPKCEAFISTWGLSECSEEAQDLAAGLGLLSAPSVLVAYQANSSVWRSAARTRELVAERGGLVYNECIEYLGAGQYYAFR